MKVKKESRIFYAPQLKTELGDLTMSEEESHHLIKVLRLKVGDSIHVVNGVGLMVHSTISDASKKSCVITIDSILEERKVESLLTIAIAPTKSIDRFEWFLEKATEIGIGTIIPFVGEHSERKVIKRDRLNKIIIAAMKQSGRLWKPELESLTTIKEVLAKAKASEKYIAHCHDEEKKKLWSGTDKSTIVLIGPEGGFSTQELNLANKSGFKGLSLGDFRLRSETAGIVACQKYNNR